VIKIVSHSQDWQLVSEALGLLKLLPQVRILPLIHKAGMVEGTEA